MTRWPRHRHDRSSPVRLADGSLLTGLLEFFEQGAAGGKAVLELIGDDLIKDSRTFAEVFQESIGGQSGTAGK
ncbi:hypothetical protein ACU635_34945 [[Actinomadura] parvosata]|uniref:hypothetical protein n=1 Tax=[Actinomadura] parvosata TaxID=1955412 RepID=UPI00406CE0D2